MRLGREEVLRIAILARLGLSEAEVDQFKDQLSQILESFEILQQVDTTGVSPTTHPITLENVLRSDEVADSLPQNMVLANAPRKDGDFFKVRAVLGDKQ
ncbi:MAG: Asp-tRNA(Asn)/Glu-tRNA(Gln) amidotransferase subunit GatC [Dehalococcoidales bacterium]|nr:Asp-tRNA(Asn)/Glu-tRNA(Gln) amidotransferase subunit GatC [Dehalococcoidales bacterium]